LCRQRGVELLEGHCMAGHLHMCVSVPPKYSVAHTLGFLQGKSAVRIHQERLHERRMTGLHFWAAGSCVSTVGLDEAQVRPDIREQEELERRQGE
jgi:putative transposase